MTTLIDEVLQLNQQYETNKDKLRDQRQLEIEEKRTVARKVAVEAITQNCVKTIKEAALSPGRNEDTPRKEAKLFEWKYSDDIKFNGCYLRDLLNKGNLLEELQALFDRNHPGKDGARAFKVYYTMMGGPNVMRHPQERRYAIFVSWDQPDWPRIEGLLQRTKQRFEQDSLDSQDEYEAPPTQQAHPQPQQARPPRPQSNFRPSRQQSGFRPARQFSSRPRI